MTPMSTARQTEEHMERNRVVGEERKRKDTANGAGPLSTPRGPPRLVCSPDEGKKVSDGQAGQATPVSLIMQPLGWEGQEKPPPGTSRSRQVPV